MAGHNKWTQIKRKKEATDADKSRLFSKLSRLISLEARKAAGNRDAPSLKTAVERARAENMPRDNIERAIEKGMGGGERTLEAITYEAYAPSGVALLIEALTDNRNKAASEIKHILSEHGTSLGAIGSASWAFTKTADGWMPNTVVETDGETQTQVETLIEKLEENEEVQRVYTNLQQPL